jgi:hypothetical protein
VFYTFKKKNKPLKKMKIIKLKINKNKNRREWLMAGLGWGSATPKEKMGGWFHHPRDGPTWGSGWLGHPIWLGGSAVADLAL